MTGRWKRDPDWDEKRGLALERDEYRCQVARFGVVHYCTTWLPMHVHHRRRRSRGGNNDLDNLVTVCAQAHAMIHGSHAKFAIEVGLLIKSQVADTEEKTTKEPDYD